MSYLNRDGVLSKMYYPHISIIIPAKDEEQNIATCLAALQTINYPKTKLEIILVDNGSSDATISIARQYNVKVLEGPKLKISGLRNLGAKHAQGEILVFIDADIVVTRDWLFNGIVKMAETGCICLGGGIDIPLKSTWVEKTWNLILKSMPEEGNVEHVASMNMFIKNDIFMKVGGFNEHLTTAEDVDLCLRMKNFGKIIYASKANVVHLGEAKNLKHFFLKERWRGQTNWLGILSHGLHFRELPSLILPLYYFYFYFIFIPFLIFIHIPLYIIITHFILFFIIPVIRSSFICLRLRHILYFFPLTFLWWLYYTARAVAIISVTERRK